MRGTLLQREDLIFTLTVLFLTCVRGFSLYSLKSKLNKCSVVVSVCRRKLRALNKDANTRHAINCNKMFYGFRNVTQKSTEYEKKIF